MVQVEGHRDGTGLGVLLHRVGNVQRALLLVLQGALGKVGAAAHEGVGQVRALEDGGGTEHLVNLDHRLGLAHRVDVEGSLGVVVFLGGV